MIINLTKPVPRPVLALGGELKNTVCCACGKTAVISDVLPNLEEKDCFDAYFKLVKELPKQFGIIPEIIAYDLHPEYISAKVAMRKDVWPKAKRVGIQHHEAHIASCAAAEGICENVLGLAFDGTGYGTDGTMWGGELFSGSLEIGFSRVAAFRRIPLAGGTAAIKEPWRIALGLAKETGIKNFQKPEEVDAQTWKIVDKMVELPPAVVSSSLGRLFDGVAALIGLCFYAREEAEAAIALEKAAGETKPDKFYSLPFKKNVTKISDFDKNEKDLWELDWRQMVKEISEDISSGIPKEKIAAAFHDSVAQTVFELCEKLKTEHEFSVILGSGGVFWNKRLTGKLKELFGEGNFIVSKKAPPSDAGLSIGQAVLAGIN